MAFGGSGKKRSANSWVRCSGDASAELEEAYVLGEPSCRGYDLNSVRDSTSRDVRRVRWPPRPETSLPEPACQLWGSKLSSNFETSTPEDRRESSSSDQLVPPVQASVKQGHSPQKRADGLSASTLAWPPAWTTSAAAALRPEVVGHAAPAADGPRQASNQYSVRESSVATYVEQDGSTSMFLAAPRGLWKPLPKPDL